MVGVAYDCLANPLGAVRSTFEKAIASGSDPASFDGRDWGAVDLFRNFLYDDGGLSQVPILNSASIRWVQPNTLVRFRGMIQDMLGNEFYVGAYKDGSVWRTNKFTDVPQFPVDSTPDMRLWERRMLYCTPVPGQNSWAESSDGVMFTSMESATQQREKRPRVDVEATDDMDVSDNGIEGSPSTKKLKENGHSSQQSITEGTSSSMITALDVNSDSLPCLIKMYDCLESDLKLNEVFEFVGVFTFDSEFKEDKDESDDLTNGFSEDVLVHLPPNKVPRLHCFIHRKLAVHDFLPRSPTIEPKPNLVKEIREALLRHLTAVLGNDGIAANFMLLHLLSMVYSRVGTVAVGKLSLNLTCLSRESAPVFGTQLGLALKNLLPFTQCISLTVDYLNTASLAPRKDYETSRLITGALQLAEGSHVIFDETRLEAGILNSVGVENARLLKTLIELQKVEYDFKFYKLDMPADIQMLVLSEGKSNILPADVVLPFHPSSVASTEVTAEALEAWRWYLATLRSLPHSIDSELQKVIENDLVAARQEDRTLGTQDFSRLLTMGRLMSMSFGETSLSLEHWQMVKELERLRRERLK
ncbi:mini-chromosome maintenance complex-binding protein-like [Pyrus ussuriensis x Pyrus communis]|uniref:Mini-chromosome maintenance complex-binding protein-like n=1 Tax=Pyrus ussuriensis x Pyrus communis TaxID=2448454 RepID=A0A5N5F2N0_9ROSA|nr:mini-chromosome maintenance complex-binding protein-like [Pyrus ussuriensis x Pyrus communis]